MSIFSILPDFMALYFTHKTIKKKKPLISQGLSDLSGWCRTANWWRCRELNPGPNALQY